MREQPPQPSIPISAEDIPVPCPKCASRNTRDKLNLGDFLSSFTCEDCRHEWRFSKITCPHCDQRIQFDNFLRSIVCGWCQRLIKCGSSDGNAHSYHEIDPVFLKRTAMPAGEFVIRYYKDTQHECPACGILYEQQPAFCNELLAMAVLPLLDQEYYSPQFGELNSAAARERLMAFVIAHKELYLAPAIIDRLPVALKKQGRALIVRVHGIDQREAVIPQDGHVVVTVLENGLMRAQYSSSGRPRLTIGRALECDICVDSRAADHYHCVLQRENDCWMLVDDGSLNGCYFEGQRISRHRVRHGDQVLIGSYFLRFESA